MIKICSFLKGPHGPFFIITILLTFLQACSLLDKLPFQQKSKNRVNLSNYQYLTEKDYLDQLNYLGKIYLNSPEIQELKLSKDSEAYLKSMIDEILITNEIFLKKKMDPKIHIIISSSPFHFSIPNGSIYLSTGLLKKYLNSEGLLAVVIAKELIRSSKNIFAKSTIIPLGYITTERFLGILRIPFEEKIEMNKWTYYVLRRAAYDPENVLNLIQIKNKNTLDFSLQLGDTKMIAREESLFKSFIVKKSVEKFEKKKINSAKGFYSLGQDLQRVNL
jgi:hypothetical protein